MNTFETLRQQWHPTKNVESFDPSTLKKMSKYWWLGPCTHEWDAVLHSRLRGSNCPYCANRKILVGFNDLVTTDPKLAEQWHSERNYPLSPQQVTAGSGKKVWWQCEDYEDHIWQASVLDRKHGKGCPYCTNRKVLAGFNDLATTHPVLTTQVHRERSLPLSPETVTAGSGKKLWWQCDIESGHVWEATVLSRVQGNNCIYCAGQKVQVNITDLQTRNPRIAGQWHPTKNGDLLPTQVSEHAHKKAWWQCPTKPQHEWETWVYSRTSKTGSECPQCWADTYVSKAENELYVFLTNLGFLVEQSNRTILAGRQELDLVIPEKAIAIEFNGLYWHDENHKPKNYHYEKWLAAQQAGIQLIQIWEDDWTVRSNVIKQALAHKLGVSTGNRIFARNTVVQQLTTHQAQEFLELNHIQGFASGSYYLGLQDKEEALTAVIVLKKEPKTDGKTLNIVRYATNSTVVGGFTKLLKYAERTYQPDSFITFADHTISDGGLYEGNEFIADKELPPDYMYVVKGERKHKFGYRLKRFRDDPELLWDESMSERELAQLNNLPRIWDAGKTRYVKQIRESR